MIDIFLWFIARPGYTLQRSRAQVPFRDLLHADVNEARAKQRSLPLPSAVQQAEQGAGELMVSIEEPRGQPPIFGRALGLVPPAMAARTEKDFRRVVGVQIRTAQKSLPKLGAKLDRPAPSNDMDGEAINRIPTRFSFIHAVEINAHDTRLHMLAIQFGRNTTGKCS